MAVVPVMGIAIIFIHGGLLLPWYPNFDSKPFDGADSAVQGSRVDQGVGYSNSADVHEVTFAQFPKGFLPEFVRSSQSSVFNLQVQSTD